MRILIRLLFMGNALLALLLLLACITPYTKPAGLPLFLSFLSLGVPLLVFLNLLAVVFWLLVRRKLALLSLAALLFSYIFLGGVFEFRIGESPVLKEDLSVMTFNAHQFNNHVKRLPGKNIDQQILAFVKEQDPDILCFQEYDRGQEAGFSQYPYQFVNYRKGRVHQAIFSKFPIINKGALNFPASPNNALFADIVYHKDTLRVYNVHLQSFRVYPSRALISVKNSEQVVRKLTQTFPKQHQQAEQLIAHKAGSPYPVLVCGDFNNTQFSHVYRALKGEMADTFEQEGTGYGRTYNFKYYPLRIDFILADDTYFEVAAHKNYNIRLSDHFPVMASFSTRKP